MFLFTPYFLGQAAFLMKFDPESEQIRDVYAHFGLAVYWGQCVEQSIFKYLVFFDHFPKAISNYTTSETWIKEFDSYEQRQMSQTMGKLIKRLKEVGEQTSTIENSLSNVLRLRNWLAHGYFSDRAVEFTMSGGRVDMISELEEMKNQFQLCTKDLDAITLPVMQKFGFNDDILSKIQADLEAGYISRKSKV